MKHRMLRCYLFLSLLPVNILFLVFLNYFYILMLKIILKKYYFNIFFK
jgi:hypothetical protein